MELKCPPEQSEVCQAIIKEKYLDYVKLRRKDAEWRSCIVESNVTFTQQADDAGLAVFAGDIHLSHRGLCLDRYGFSQLRNEIRKRSNIAEARLHLDEKRQKKEPTPVAEPVAVVVPTTEAKESPKKR